MKIIIVMLAMLQLPVCGQAADVPRAQLEAVLADALAQKLAAEGVGIVLDRNLPALTGEGGVTVATLDVDPARQGFTATLRIGSTEQVVTGRYSRQIQALVPVRDLTSGEVIAEADLDWLLVDEKALSARVAAEPEQLVDMEVRRPLKAGKLVLARDVRAPLLIHKGDTVTVRLETPTLNLSMQGRALGDAGMNETIRVLNLSSKKTIEGIVTSAQTVAIAPPMGTPMGTPMGKRATVALDMPRVVR